MLKLKTNKKNIIIKVLLTALLLILGAGIAFYVVTDFDGEMPSPDVPISSMQPNEPKKQAIPIPATRQEQPVPPAFATASINSANVAELTSLLSDLELKKAKLAVKKVEKEIKEIEGVGQSVAPSFLPPVQPATILAAPISLPSVVAIGGLDSALRAVLLTDNGTVSVKTGDRIGELRVVSISQNEVQVRDGNNRLHTLGFKGE